MIPDQIPNFDTILNALRPKQVEVTRTIVADLPDVSSFQFDELVDHTLNLIDLSISKTKDGQYRSPYSLWCHRFGKSLIEALRARSLIISAVADNAIASEMASLKFERDEAVSAVRRLTDGQPFDAVVIADAVARGTYTLQKLVVERDLEISSLKAQLADPIRATNL